MGKKAKSPTRPSRLCHEGDKIELLIELPVYGLVKGDLGKILVCYDTYDKDLKENDFEVFFDKIGTSVQLVEAQFKLL
nr:hypothetical protein [Candidatus Sigynarchaeota archaeon]